MLIETSAVMGTTTHVHDGCVRAVRSLRSFGAFRATFFFEHIVSHMVYPRHSRPDRALRHSYTER